MNTIICSSAVVILSFVASAPKPKFVLAAVAVVAPVPPLAMATVPDTFAAAVVSVFQRYQ